MFLEDKYENKVSEKLEIFKGDLDRYLEKNTVYFFDKCMQKGNFLFWASKNVFKIRFTIVDQFESEENLVDFPINFPKIFGIEIDKVYAVVTEVANSWFDKLIEEEKIQDCWCLQYITDAKEFPYTHNSYYKKQSAEFIEDQMIGIVLNYNPKKFNINNLGLVEAEVFGKVFEEIEVIKSNLTECWIKSDEEDKSLDKIAEKGEITIKIDNIKYANLAAGMYETKIKELFDSWSDSLVKKEKLKNKNSLKFNITVKPHTKFGQKKNDYLNINIVLRKKSFFVPDKSTKVRKVVKKKGSDEDPDKVKRGFFRFLKSNKKKTYSEIEQN